VPDLLEGVGGAYAIPPVSWKTRLTVRAQKIQNPAPDGVLNGLTHACLEGFSGTLPPTRLVMRDGAGGLSSAPGGGTALMTN
jgi:hypothetical protein